MILAHYGANVEKAVNVITSLPKEELKEPVLVPTPNIAKIEDVVANLGVEIERTVKAIMYKDMVTDEPYMVLVRGDIEVNEVKVKNIIDTIDVAMLTDEELEALGLFKGFIGPYGMDLKAKGIKIIADPSVTEIPNHTAGGNQPDTHYLNVNYGRDYEADIVADVRKVKEGDICSICGKPLRVARGIECGHIFKLGKKYLHQ